MLVVSDTTPLNILTTLSQENILPSLFHSVVIPPAVVHELSRPSTADAVRAWIANPPPWLTVKSPTSPVPSGVHRHRGEREAMLLAVELNAEAILLDDHMARAQANELGLTVIGTLGLLELAANRGLISDLTAVHNQLRKSWFFVTEKLLSESLSRHRERIEKNSKE